MRLRPLRSPAAALTFFALLASPVLAQDPNQDMRDDIEELKKGQQQIQKQLQEISKQLQAKQAPSRPAAPNVRGKVFEIGDNPVRGVSTAKLTLVEFTDYQ